MAINVFEGARRIYLLAALWAIGVAVYLYNDDLLVRATYVVRQPGAEAIRVADAACGMHDREEWINRTTSGGTNVRATICFTAQSFDGGKMHVPYRTDKARKLVWADESYSSQVREYAERVGNSFSLGKAEETWLDGQRWSARLAQLKSAALWLFGGWLFLWFVTATIGWIVRGFAGIPSGQDYKPRI